MRPLEYAIAAQRLLPLCYSIPVLCSVCDTSYWTETNVWHSAQNERATLTWLLLRFLT